MAGGGSDDTTKPSRGALVNAVSWTAFAAIIIAALVLSVLAFQGIRADYDALARTITGFQEQVLRAETEAEAPPEERTLPPHPVKPLESVPAGQNEPVGWITNPDWLERPSGRDFARYYPTRALSLGIEGRAVIECGVGLDGRLHDCEVIEEAPEGMEFGAATVSMARHFRMTPQLRDGEPVGGARVRIPITWLLG